MLDTGVATVFTADSPLAPRPAAPPRATRLQLQALAAQLYQLAAAQRDKQSTIGALLNLAIQATNAAGGAYFAPDDAGRWLPRLAAPDPSRPWHGADQEQLAQWCTEAAAQGSTHVHRLADGQLVAIVVPVTLPDHPREAMVIALRLGRERPEPFVVTLQLVASYVTVWSLVEAAAEGSWQVRAAAAALELVHAIQVSEDVQHAGYVIVNQLQGYLECEQVALAVPGPTGVGCTLRAVSGRAEFDRHSAPIRLLEAVANEATLHDVPMAWPPLTPTARQATLAHRQLVEQSHVESVVSCPLRTKAGQLVAVCILVGEAKVLHAPPTLNFLRASAPHLGGALAVVRRASGGPLGHLLARLLAPTHARRRFGALTVAALLLALCSVPWPHKIAARGTVEPLHRRFVVVPYDGTLKQSLARPGDLVREQQLLASMEDRELRWQRSSLAADRASAAKKYDTGLAAHDVPAAQLARLEMQRLDVQLRLLQHHMANLELRAPTAGVILSGDLEDALGAPVRIGQAIYEIAALDRLKLEVAVPDDDIAWVQPGMRVSTRLDGVPGAAIEGSIARIRPRAEVREGQNVFVADVVLENPGHLLRPGMKGACQVIGQRQRLGWLWFHKAWERTQRWWG